jgi:hypothetical protein
MFGNGPASRMPILSAPPKMKFLQFAAEKFTVAGVKISAENS